MIIDAQDYLDKWHLAVICKVQPKNSDETIKVNFLPYPKGNRDEWMTEAELANRISGPFINTEPSEDRETIEKNLTSLRDYVQKFVSPGQ